MNNKIWRIEGYIMLIYCGIFIMASVYQRFIYGLIPFCMLFLTVSIALVINSEKNKLIDYLEAKQNGTNKQNK